MYKVHQLINRNYFIKSKEILSTKLTSTTDVERQRAKLSQEYDV